MTSKLRSEIKAKAINVVDMMQLGKEGITEGVLVQAEKLLFDHEILKVRILKNCSLEPKEALEILTQKLKAQPIQAIGNKCILYKFSTKQGIKHIIEQ